MLREKNGFTMIELLAVIVLLAVIATITIPGVTTYLSSSKSKTYEMDRTSMTNSATSLFADCMGNPSLPVCGQYSAPSAGNYVNVPLSSLIEFGYIDQIADPDATGAFCDADKSFVVVKNEASESDFNAKLEYNACLYCSKYKTDSCDFSESSYKIANPNNFTINQCYNFNTYLTENHIDLNSKIYLNGQDVNKSIMPTPSTVDTTKVGTFALNYTYSDLSATTNVRVLDITKPGNVTTSMKANGASYSGTSWTGYDVVSTFSATDKTICSGVSYNGSGINKYQYSKDQKTWIDTTSSFTHNQTYNGNYYVRAVDKDGNVGNIVSYKMMVDKTAPKMVSATLITTEDGKAYNGASTYQNVKVSLSGTDGESGFDHFIYSTDNGVHWNNISNPYTFNTTQTATYKIKAVDKVGNISTNTVTFGIVINKNVSVSFNANGGSVSPTSKTIVYGNTYGTLPTPSRSGYTFVGWFTAASGGSQVTSGTSATNHNYHTLYAHWAAKSYTVSFNGNGGSSVSSKTVIHGSTYGTLSNSSRTGYTFAGWFTAASGGSQVTSGTTVTITSNQTLYAHWNANQYTLSFNANGGSGVSSKTITYGSTYGTLSNSSRAGYTFAGWFTAASGGSQVSSGTIVTITSSQTLYAHWNANNYTLDINPDFNNSGATYAGGAHVQSFDLKIVDEFGNQLYYGTGLQDYCNSLGKFNGVYYITNVKYKSGYAYNGYSLRSDTAQTSSNLAMIYAASNGTAFTFRHTRADTMWFSINTKATKLNGYIMGMAGSSQGNGVVSNYYGYRYRGYNPNNYIYYNNELWRIVGVFDNNNHGASGNLVKIVRTTISGQEPYGNDPGDEWYCDNNWFTCSLRNNLQNVWYYYNVSQTYKNMTAWVNWRVPRLSDISLYNAYNQAMSSPQCGGNIAMVMVSDYGFASSSCSISNSAAECSGNNWLYNTIGGYTWFLDAPAGNDNNGIYMAGGFAESRTRVSIYVYPSVYLNESVCVSGGNGTSSNPYTIVGSC